MSESSGLTHAGWGMGACVGDYDNDGFDDLHVTYYGGNVLYRVRAGAKEQQFCRFNEQQAA